MNHNQLIHYGTLGMRWGTRRSQKRIDRLARKTDKLMRKHDRGSKSVDIDTFKDLSRKARKETSKANKRIARINRYLNRTKGESVNNMLVKVETNPELLEHIQDIEII